ncbi:MAG: DsrE family protein [Ignavibacteriae bacterium]|nr:DsrE family protein [Ignavibacteriota bacterium]
MKYFVLFVLAVSAFSYALAQGSDYRVVFDMTSRDSLDQKAVMRWVKEIAKANPKAELEVVMYGKGFELVMPEKSTVLADVKEVIRMPGVSLRVCKVALKNNNVDEKMLVEGVGTVPDGIYEIIAKQRAGWGYIKVAH